MERRLSDSELEASIEVLSAARDEILPGDSLAVNFEDLSLSLFLRVSETASEQLCDLGRIRLQEIKKIARPGHVDPNTSTYRLHDLKRSGSEYVSRSDLNCAVLTLETYQTILNYQDGLEEQWRNRRN